MAMRVKAVEKLLKFDKNSAGVYRYVMSPEMYSSLNQKKVIREAALRSGVSQGVKAGLITSRRIIFTPAVELKDELAGTAIQITCYDRDGKEVKRVTSTSGEVEDPENPSGPESGNGGNTNTSQTGGGLPDDGD